ncbi:MAG: phosphoesterase [Aquificae bacterium]|nr:phosphoesterase [Aquificota bacterium]
MENVSCIYHGNCIDGTTAAAVVLKKFPQAECYPLEHGYESKDLEAVLDSIDKSHTVYIVDFSLRERDLETLLNKAGEVINIDHHISAKDTLERFDKSYKNFKFVFNNNRSGASLSWEYLFKTDPPMLVKYVEDQDIWKWEYGETTRYVNLFLLPYTNKPEEIVKLLEAPIEPIVEKGKVINSFTQYLIERYLEKAKEVKLKIGEYTVKGYNTNYFQSEIGNRLSTKYNQAVALFSIAGEDVKISFRSNTGNKPDALDLAKILGGGGHRNAAGAKVSLKEFIKMIQLEDSNG